MTTLLFLITLVTLSVLLITTLIAAFRRRPTRRKVISMIFILGGYGILWVFCYMQEKLVEVPLGTDICFDDWCATVTKVDRLMDSTTIVLHIRMSNHARGISQKPDEPRIHLLDRNGKRYKPIHAGNPPLDSRLQLHESLETVLTYSVPKSTRGLVALLEEGPFIAQLIFPGSRQVFPVN